MHTHTCTHKHAHSDTHAHGYTCICTHTQRHTHALHAHTHAPRHTHTHVCTHTYMQQMLVPFWPHSCHGAVSSGWRGPNPSSAPPLRHPSWPAPYSPGTPVSSSTVWYPDCPLLLGLLKKDTRQHVRSPPSGAPGPGDSSGGRHRGCH